jgi:hypothetical protein
LGVRAKAGEVRATFRILAKDGDLDYLELYLARSTADGGVRIVDARELRVGITLSEKLRVERMDRSDGSTRRE